MSMDRIVIEVEVNNEWCHLTTYPYSASRTTNAKVSDRKTTYCRQGAINEAINAVDKWRRYHRYQDCKFRVVDCFHDRNSHEMPTRSIIQ